MAPQKRSRATEDIDGDVEVEIESANSSFQQTHNSKRSRVSRAADPDGSANEEDYYEDLLASSPPGGGYAEQSMIDVSSDNESESESIDELQATQMVKKQAQRMGENLASEQGVIMEIQIRNFMCHKNVRVTFGPLINFITGANGSGKSAILTALQVCLGTKAKSTNRAPNLSAMVKTGEENASLAVKLKNGGEDAFKPHLYGASILVERHFNRSGTSSFKIKNDQGKIITTKKKDLDEITESFGLQLDNPINVLTQDRAREFLSNSTPAEKYKFFIQGTQLQALDSDYNLMEETLDRIEEAASIAAGDLDTLKENAQKAEERKKRLDRAAAMQEKMRDVQRQHAWCQVEEQERLLEGMTNDLRRQQEVVEAHQEGAEEAGNAYEAHNTSYEAAQRAIEVLKEQLPPLEQAQLEAKEKFDNNKAELLKSQTEQRNIKTSWTTAKADVVRLENDLTEEERRLSGTAADAHQERLKELEVLKSDAEQARQAYKDHHATGRDRENDKTRAEEALAEQKEPVARARRELQAAESALSATQRDQGDEMRGYDRRIKDVLAAIHRETRWRVKPVGPMGRYIRITQPEWTSILEKSFGAVLNSFVVTDKDDQAILSRIIENTGMKDVSVFISRARGPLSTDGKEPDAALSTVYRILRFENDAVRNTLIINQAIEQLVLVEKRAQGEDILWPADGRQVRNIRAVLTHAARGHGLRLNATRTGGQRTDPIGAYGGLFRMKTDKEQQLRVQKSARDDAKRKEDEEVQEQKRLERELIKANQALELHKRRLKQLKTEAQRAEDRVEALQTEIDSNRPQTGRLDELKKQLAEAKQDVDSAYGSLEDSIKAKAVLDTTGKDLKGTLDEAQRELDLVKGRILEQKQRLEMCEDKRREALYAKNAKVDDVTKANEQLVRLQGKADGQQNNLNAFLEGAAEVCPRIAVEPGVTVEQLDDRLEKFEAQYQREEQQAGGTMEELVAAHRKAQKEYEDKRKELKSQKATVTVSQPHYSLIRMLTFIVSTEPQRRAERAKTSLGSLPQVHHRPRPLQLPIPPLRAPIPRQGPHGPRRQDAQHQRRARCHQDLRFRSSSQHSQWWREVFQSNLLAAEYLGGHGKSHSLLGRV